MAIWDQLFALDSKLVPQPQMVESYDALGGTGCTGASACATACCSMMGRRRAQADCVASINRWAHRDLFGRRLAAQLDEMRAVDDRQFRDPAEGALQPVALRLRRHLLLHHAGAGGRHPRQRRRH
jgi:peptide/nickel transport system substrate-binding protein